MQSDSLRMTITNDSLAQTHAFEAAVAPERGAGAVAVDPGVLAPPVGETFHACRVILHGKLCPNAQKDTLYSIM